MRARRPFVAGRSADLAQLATSLADAGGFDPAEVLEFHLRRRLTPPVVAPPAEAEADAMGHLAAPARLAETEPEQRILSVGGEDLGPGVPSPAPKFVPVQ